MSEKLPDPKKFSERLGWLRAQTGLTQEEFGRRARVTKGYISRLESGERENPSDTFLRSCCDAYGVPMEWLELGDGELPAIDRATFWVEQVNPEARTQVASSVEPQEELTGLMRVLLEAVPMTGDMVLKFNGLVWESPEMSETFKHRAMLAASIAFTEREQRKERPGA
jgi:transcriptional regulator with XRE-family HTH domain